MEDNRSFDEILEEFTEVLVQCEVLLELVEMFQGGQA